MCHGLREASSYGINQSDCTDCRNAVSSIRHAVMKRKLEPDGDSLLRWFHSCLSDCHRPESKRSRLLDGFNAQANKANTQRQKFKVELKALVAFTGDTVEKFRLAPLPQEAGLQPVPAPSAPSASSSASPSGSKPLKRRHTV